MTAMTPTRLTFEMANYLAPRLSAADQQECRDLGFTPSEALEWAALDGAFGYLHAKSLAVGVFSSDRLPGDSLVGSVGVTQDGRLWSLWRALTLPEKVSIFRTTPGWVKFLVQQSGLPEIFNIATVANRQACRWIEKCGCFDVEKFPDSKLIFFKTKPLPVLIELASKRGAE